jgi:hypothetical protein
VKGGKVEEVEEVESPMNGRDVAGATDQRPGE